VILVTAANGNQGKRLIPKLIAAELPVRACVSTQASADQLRRLGVTEVVIGDICDPAVASDAVRGVEKIYHVGPTAHPNERQMGISLVDAARAAGVQHFVMSSVLHAIVTDLVQHEIKRDIEEHLVSSGLGFTILQPTNYMLPLKLRRVFTEGIFEMNWALDRYQSLVDLGDVTEVACAVLTDSARHDGATYELVSPGRYNAHELGEIIASVLGRPIEVRQVNVDDYMEAWFGKDLDSEKYRHQSNVMRAISTYYSHHDFVGNPNVLTWLLGRAPTTFAEFVSAQRDAFSGSTERK
jgi:uncharacterized protein YbjT (DUF2867 family)